MTNPRLSNGPSARYTVVVSFIDATADGTSLTYNDVTLGPYRTREAAERKAKTLTREVLDWDQDGLQVTIQPILPGGTSAKEAMAVLFGSHEPRYRGAR